MGRGWVGRFGAHLMRREPLKAGSRVGASMASGGAPRVLQDGTERTHGRTALRNNVAAAVALAGAVRSTLGPHGLDKMLVDDDGGVLLTNDGVTVLTTAAVEHPTAKLLISGSQAQDRVARDGTTTSIVLCAELLQNALELVERGVHPVLITEGYQQASVLAEAALDDIARPLGEDRMERAVLTALDGKGDTQLQRTLTTLAIEAARHIAVTDEDGTVTADPTMVKTIADQGGVARDSTLVHGLVLAKRRRDLAVPLPEGGGRIALIDGSLQKRDLTWTSSLKVEQAGAYTAFLDRERAEVTRATQAVIETGASVVICREAIDDDAARLLSKAGVVCYRRMERADLELVARATGATLVDTPEHLTSEALGDFTSLSERRWHGTWHMVLEGAETGGATLVIRGTSGERQAEAERAFGDALGVACGLLEDDRVLPGGGASAMAVAQRLREAAPGVDGRQQLAVEAFAAALESLPGLLAQNAGRDAIDEVLGLAAAQTKARMDATTDEARAAADWIGLDLHQKAPTDMAAAGVLDPRRVTRQAWIGAVEGAVSVLRIDDLVWARQDPTMPDWQDEEDLAQMEERQAAMGSDAGFAPGA